MDNNKSLRALGGSSFADSMMRFNASSDSYIKYVVSNINRFLFEDKECLTFEIKGEEVHIYYCDQELIKTDFKSIETYRCISASAFDKLIINLLEKTGCQFDPDNFYYIRLKK